MAEVRPLDIKRSVALKTSMLRKAPEPTRMRAAQILRTMILSLLLALVASTVARAACG
jgi:hypothetical protein